MSTPCSRPTARLVRSPVPPSCSTTGRCRPSSVPSGHRRSCRRSCGRVAPERARNGPLQAGRGCPWPLRPPAACQMPMRGDDDAESDQGHGPGRGAVIPQLAVLPRPGTTDAIKAVHGQRRRRSCRSSRPRSSQLDPRRRGRGQGRRGRACCPDAATSPHHRRLPGRLHRQGGDEIVVIPPWPTISSGSTAPARSSRSRSGSPTTGRRCQRPTSMRRSGPCSGTSS